jgi:hypothetical protein
MTYSKLRSCRDGCRTSVGGIPGLGGLPVAFDILQCRRSKSTGLPWRQAAAWRPLGYIHQKDPNPLKCSMYVSVPSGKLRYVLAYKKKVEM